MLVHEWKPKDYTFPDLRINLRTVSRSVRTSSIHSRVGVPVSDSSRIVSVAGIRGSWLGYLMMLPGVGPATNVGNHIAAQRVGKFFRATTAAGGGKARPRVGRA